MKKILSCSVLILITLVLTSCFNNKSKYDVGSTGAYNVNSSIYTSTQAISAAKNYVESYAYAYLINETLGCTSISIPSYGQCSATKKNSETWIVDLKGTFFGYDEYGNVEGKYQFETDIRERYSFTVDTNTGSCSCSKYTFNVTKVY